MRGLGSTSEAPRPTAPMHVAVAKSSATWPRTLGTAQWQCHGRGLPVPPGSENAGFLPFRAPFGLLSQGFDHDFH